MNPTRKTATSTTPKEDLIMLIIDRLASAKRTAQFLDQPNSTITAPVYGENGLIQRGFITRTEYGAAGNLRLTEKGRQHVRRLKLAYTDGKWQAVSKEEREVWVRLVIPEESIMSDYDANAIATVIDGSINETHYESDWIDVTVYNYLRDAVDAWQEGACEKGDNDG